MNERRFDVVIAGAGPAGATSALRLARAGFHVAIVEPCEFPRAKPCGEFMSPECLPLLRELGVATAVDALGGRGVSGMALHAAGRRVVGRFATIGRAAPPIEHGLAVRREKFDAVLLDAALATGGVTLLTGHRVQRLLRGDAGRVEGVVTQARDGAPLRLRARWTLGADGVQSRVARELGVRRELPWLKKVALTTHLAGVAWGDEAEVHFFAGGYFACAPVDGGLLSLNLVVDQSAWRGRQRESGFAEYLARVPRLAEKLAGARRAAPLRGVGAMACRTTRQVVDGAALVGDAAGYIDPVTGEGIFFALKGAQLLAESVAAALHGARRDAAALAGYQRGRAKEIVARCRLATLLQRGLRRETIVRAAFALLEARPRLADLIVSVTGDYVPMRELLRPSVWKTALTSAS